MVLLHKSKFCFENDNSLIKAILDENMFCIWCNISHQCGCPRQLTYSIGFQDKDRGKEGNSKTGSYMSRRIHVSSMTVDTTIGIVLTLQRLYTFPTRHNPVLLPTSGRWLSTHQLVYRQRDRDEVFYLDPPKMWHAHRVWHMVLRVFPQTGPPICAEGSPAGRHLICSMD
jgi:hypothetical protein